MGDSSAVDLPPPKSNPASEARLLSDELLLLLLICGTITVETVYFFGEKSAMKTPSTAHIPTEIKTVRRPCQMVRAKAMRSISDSSPSGRRLYDIGSSDMITKVWL